MAKELNIRQAKFVDEYLIDNNGAAAAVRAGYSPNGSKVTANKMLNMPAVKDLINKAKIERSERTKIDADFVLLQLGDMQKAMISEILNDDGGLKDISEWPDVWQRMVVGIDVFEEYDGSGKDKTLIGYTKRVKLMDRTRILHMLGQHVAVNAFKETVDVNVKGSLGERLMQSRKRLGSTRD